MEIFAQHNAPFFKLYIDLENGIPGHDTIWRVMALIKPDILHPLVNEWHKLITRDEQLTIQKLIHIDRKAYVAINAEAAHLHIPSVPIAATTTMPQDKH